MKGSKKIAVVTGGAKGIGRAICLRLSLDGVSVAVWDRNEKESLEVVDSIRQSGGIAEAFVGDTTSTDSIALLLDQTNKSLGKVNILVNNVGASDFCPFQDISEDSWDRIMNVNLKGLFLCTQAVIGDMVSDCWGRIVNITSIAAQDGGGGAAMAHYSASKAGVMGLTKALALEFAGNGITVNNIPPALIDTPMLRRTVFNLDGAAAHFPVKRMGRVEDVAGACSYLVSDEAAFVTGQTLSVNGGRYLT